MHLYDFMSNLDMLRKPDIIDRTIYPQYPKDEILYLDYSCNKDTAQLSYCTLDQPKVVKFVDVSEQCRYLEALNRQIIGVDLLSDTTYFETALMEGIWLLDTLTSSHFEFIDLVHGADVDVMYALYTTNQLKTGEAVLWVFNNNILLRDIAIAQIEYFIKKYILFHFAGKDKVLHNGCDVPCDSPGFKAALQKAVIEYVNITEKNGKFKSEPITGVYNKNLEDIVQQLSFDEISLR